jgi:hypothetical protein
VSSSRKNKSVESLEDAFLKALERDDSREAGAGQPATGGQAAGPPAAAPDAAAQPVTGRHGIQLLIAADRMSASVALTGREKVSAREIAVTLLEAEITHGIDQAEIEKAARFSQQPGKYTEFLLARGTPPELSRRVRFACLPEQESGLVRDGGRLKEVFAATEAITVQTSTVMAKAVNAGEIFLRVEEYPQARPGMDVFGRELPCPADPLPAAGDNVRSNEQAGGYEATAYGYLLVAGDTVSVLPPLWITADRTAACYVSLPQIPPCRYPHKLEVREMLLRAGIHELCISDAAIDVLVGQMAAGIAVPRLVKLAETVQPRAGRNAGFSLFVDTEKKAGTLRSDGSLDLRERTAVVSIPAGMLIAEKALATKGADGCTLFGKPIKAVPGVDKKITAGKGVRLEETENSIRYFAERTGNIKFKQNVLAVEDIYKISGDIDYNTGNIDIKTDLLITGSVLRGFTVKSEGDIAIMGTVENGATVMAGGNLTVDKGIIGADSKVVVLGNLCTTYIQDAEVIVKGSVVVKSYLFNSSLIASGSITVLKEQGPKSGRAVGGILCSSREIRLSTLGSPANPATVVAVRTDPEMTAKLKKIEEQAQFCTQNIAKISRSLPFDSFDPGQIKAVLAGVPAAKREGIILLLSNLNKLIKNRKTLTDAVERMRAMLDTALQQAGIEIQQQVYKGSEIHIGKHTLVINEDMGTSSFQLRDGRIVRN